MSYGVMEESHRDSLAEILMAAFGTDRERCQWWMTRAPASDWRVLAEESVLGGLLLIPMAQWYGGNQVPCTGIAGVGVKTTARGRKVGQRLITGMIRELHEKSVALSALYPSTTSFYRRNGYERAGSRLLAEVNIRDLTARSGPLEVRELEGNEVHEFYHQWRRQDACLVRNDYLWNRVKVPRGTQAEGFGFYEGSNLRGYAYFKREKESLQVNQFEITDMVLTNLEAAQTFLGHLAAHRQFFQTAYWPTTPNDPLFMLLPEPWNYRLRLDSHWMLRITNLKKALEQRGFPKHLSVELHLSVDDGQIPEQSGPYILRVDEGVGHLESGGRAELSCDIGALASLYSGFISAESLASVGRVQGSAETLALASALFRGEPRMTDFF